MRQRSSYPKPFKVQVVQKAQCGKVWLRGNRAAKSPTELQH